MKKRFFWLVLAGAALAVYLWQQPVTNSVVLILGEDQARTESFAKNAALLKVNRDQIYQGNLLLVNKSYPVHSEFEASEAVNLFQNRELVKHIGLLDNSIRLSPDLAEQLSVMTEAAAEEGVSRFLISSGYRDADEQQQLYEQMGAHYALPAGHSEHNLGLSLDLGSSQAAMNEAPEGRWLKQNAAKYGFILRYPENKTEITGIQYEPWHFRYTGLPHSLIMKDKDMVLEEYLDFLKEQGKITAMAEGQTYEISYYKVTEEGLTLQVPRNQRFELSGNNIDGVILTVFR